MIGKNSVKNQTSWNQNQSLTNGDIPALAKANICKTDP